MVDQRVDQPASRLRAHANCAGHDRRDRLWVANGCEVDQPRTAGVLFEDLRGQLEGQPGLARTPGAGQRQHSGPGEELVEHGELGLASDEARELHRKVVRDIVECAKRGEVGFQVRVKDLEDVLGPSEVLETVRAEVLEADAVRQIVDDEVVHDLGEDDLTAVSRVSKAGGAVEGGPDIVALVSQLHFTGVDPDAEFKRSVGELSLDLERARQAVGRLGEGGDEAVSLALLDGPHAVVTGDGAVDHVVDLGEVGPHGVGALFPLPGRALYVGQHERDRPDRQHEVAALVHGRSGPPHRPVERARTLNSVANAIGHVSDDDRRAMPEHRAGV